MARINLLLGFKSRDKSVPPVVLYTGPDSSQLEAVMAADTSCVRFKIHYGLENGGRNKDNPRHPSAAVPAPVFDGAEKARQAAESKQSLKEYKAVRAAQKKAAEPESKKSKKEKAAAAAAEASGDSAGEAFAEEVLRDDGAPDIDSVTGTADDFQPPS